jgi:hypothetical protein
MDQFYDRLNRNARKQYFLKNLPSVHAENRDFIRLSEHRSTTCDILFHDTVHKIIKTQFYFM